MNSYPIFLAALASETDSDGPQGMQLLLSINKLFLPTAGAILAPQTVKGTLVDFFAAASNKEDRVNCLDMPIHNGRVPDIVT